MPRCCGARLLARCLWACCQSWCTRPYWACWEAWRMVSIEPLPMSDRRCVHARIGNEALLRHAVLRWAGHPAQPSMLDNRWRETLSMQCRLCTESFVCRQVCFCILLVNAAFLLLVRRFLHGLCWRDQGQCPAGVRCQLQAGVQSSAGGCAHCEARYARHGQGVSATSRCMYTCSGSAAAAGCSRTWALELWHALAGGQDCAHSSAVDSLAAWQWVGCTQRFAAAPVFCNWCCTGCSSAAAA